MSNTNQNSYREGGPILVTYDISTYSGHMGINPQIQGVPASFFFSSTGSVYSMFPDTSDKIEATGWAKVTGCDC